MKLFTKGPEKIMATTDELRQRLSQLLEDSSPNGKLWRYPMTSVLPMWNQMIGDVLIHFLDFCDKKELSREKDWERLGRDV